MSKHNVVELSGRDTNRDELTELIRDGAHKLISEALEAEVSDLLSALSGRRDAPGRAAVVRNGYQPEPPNVRFGSKADVIDSVITSLADVRFRPQAEARATQQPCREAEI